MLTLEGEIRPIITLSWLITSLLWPITSLSWPITSLTWLINNDYQVSHNSTDSATSSCQPQQMAGKYWWNTLFSLVDHHEILTSHWLTGRISVVEGDRKLSDNQGSDSRCWGLLVQGDSLAQGCWYSHESQDAGSTSDAEVCQHSSHHSLLLCQVNSDWLIVINTDLWLVVSLVESVQSDIASESPGLFDIFRDGLAR